MLKQRVVTALIIAVPLLLIILLGNLALLAAALLLMLLLAAREWANLAGITAFTAQLVYAVLLVLAWGGAAFYLHFDFQSLPNTPELQGFLGASVFFWAIALLWVQGYPSSALLWRPSFVRLSFGLFILVPMAIALLALAQQSRWLLLMPVLIVVFADSGAYFVGRRWGRHKLAPSVSPGKTWEGFFGGLLCCLLLALVSAKIAGLESARLTQWLLIVTVTAGASVLGDLFESMLKRERGIKDSGSLLPGHGGILDRIDSVSAAAPVFALQMLLVGWI